MPIAVFGSKVFDVTNSKIYTITEFQYSSTLDTEKQDSVGKKPSTYNKGPGLNALAIKAKLDVSHGVNPRKEIEDWERIKDAGIAYPFILGVRPLGKNKYLLVEVQATDFQIDNKGAVLSADLALKFDEYVRAGSAKDTGQKTAPGIRLEDLIKPSATKAEKAELKRQGMSRQTLR